MNEEHEGGDGEQSKEVERREKRQRSDGEETNKSHLQMYYESPPNTTRSTILSMPDSFEFGRTWVQVTCLHMSRTV